MGQQAKKAGWELIRCSIKSGLVEASKPDHENRGSG